jgi:8-oxo-dGTP pyrophosphatase MutT (NUDIX family)
MLSTELIANLTTASNLPTQLAAALTQHRARGSGGKRMAHELNYGRHFGPPPATARHAAVVLLLFRRGGQWRVPVTLRPAALAHHGGQISLPGGMVEQNETSELAAIRELREELGVAGPVSIIGHLANRYVYASDFLIRPWLAVSAREPEWRPNADEVERVVELPLERLLDPHAVGETIIERGPLVFRAPCYRVDEHCIWGVTCVILNELAIILRNIANLP